jgi:type IV pilus assembly protein PilV
MYMKLAPPIRARAAGFSLVEVMVALVVVSIGLLGLAKMETLGLSATTASSRSIAAIEASGMAAAMHANPGYWASGSAPATTVVAASNNFSGSTACLTPGTNSCTPQQMANYDMEQWAVSLQAVLPGYYATIACTTTLNIPVTCTIQIQWSENGVAVNSQQTNIGTLAGTVTTPTYTLFVQP